MTGTVLQGSIKIGETLEIPSLAMSKKVKSMQMFRKGIDQISQGDRAGVCVTQFDPNLLERGLVCSPGAAPISYAVIMQVNSIAYYKGDIKSKAKFHISLGHETVMSKVPLFTQDQNGNGDVFDPTQEYEYQDVYSTEKD